MTIPDETMQHEERFFSRTTYKPRFFENVILIALAIIALVSISVFLSYYTVGTDFSNYYHVGNVINNAKDAMEHLDEKLIIIKTYEIDKLVKLQISNRGQKIPEYILDRIFLNHFLPPKKKALDWA